MASKGFWAGWVAFAGFLMLIIGTLDSLQRLTALIKDEYDVLVPNRILVFDMTTWVKGVKTRIQHQNRVLTPFRTPGDSPKTGPTASSPPHSPTRPTQARTAAETTFTSSDASSRNPSQRIGIFDPHSLVYASSIRIR
jgi:hypothetical protein